MDDKKESGGAGFLIWLVVIATVLNTCGTPTRMERLEHKDSILEKRIFKLDIRIDSLTKTDSTKP